MLMIVNNAYDGQ